MSIIHGDCLATMPTLEAESVDAIVCDPPYGLAFMGKAWDHGVPGMPFWTEALRVAKPGAYLLAFGGTRTFHRLACAIEDAGWEMRDCLSWLYGSGFPKSLDVSKAMDKARRRDFVAAAIRLGVPLPGRSVDDWTKEDHAPGEKWWTEFKRSLPPSEWERIEREVIGYGKSGDTAWFAKGEHDRTAPATDLAKQWDGWGTALKPAWEPIILARKPLTGTVAANVTEHGTGALNIDGCRIEGAPRTTHPEGNRRTQPGTIYGGGKGLPVCEYPGHAGRWPANVVLDEEAARLLDAMSGERGSFLPAGRDFDGGVTGTVYGAKTPHKTYSYGDNGGASRFYYTAKASRGERGAGLDCIEIVSVSYTTWENEDREARLQVATDQSQPRAIAVSGTPDNCATAWSTFLFGSPTTVSYLRDTKSITATATSSTTDSKTLSWLVRSLTNVCTLVASGATANGGSLAETAASSTPLLTITREPKPSRHGADLAASITRLSIRGNAASPASHPTVKPLALMRWLCRLVTPPSGLILDPFCGSGSTGCAAVLEGFRFLGIERESEYVAIAERRIAHWAATVQPEFEAIA